jgi:hypothetical protein
MVSLEIYFVLLSISNGNKKHRIFVCGLFAKTDETRMKLVCKLFADNVGVYEPSCIEHTATIGGEGTVNNKWGGGGVDGMVPVQKDYLKSIESNEINKDE